MRGLLIFLLGPVLSLTPHAQVTFGTVTLGTVSIGSTGSGPITGGQMAMPSSTVIGQRFPYVFISTYGAGYFAQNGAASNPETGLWWTPSAAACETSPGACSWSLVNKAGQPTVGGIIDMISQMMDIDSTHILIVFGYDGQAGKCDTDRICELGILNTSTNTFSLVTLPSHATNQSLSYITRDSTGLCYTQQLYGGGPLWRSGDATCSGTWTQITTGYTSLPGLSTANGNVYNGHAIGNRLYFGGEGGVMSCDLAFTACSQDYLPFTDVPPHMGTRNFSTLLTDQDYGSTLDPSLMIECCKQDQSVANYATISRFTTAGGWAQLTTSSGLPQFNTSDFYNNYGLTQGTGTGRLYYLILGAANGSTARRVWVSTNSSATNFTTWSSSILPASTASLKAEEITQGSSGTRKWFLFCGTGIGSASNVYITP